ncbi:MAG: hypothetical protein WC119_00620 [Synergistaceae bacterium]
MLKGCGIVRYPGYKDGGAFKMKGMKNKRKKHMFLQKMALLREKAQREREDEERRMEWEGYAENY